MDDLVFLVVKWFLGSDMRYNVTDVTDDRCIIYIYIYFLFFFYFFFITVIF